ncbi:MAG: hypothetical protein V3T83_04505 [Acidobacteriota bacterium]
MIIFPGRIILAQGWRVFADAQDSSLAYLDTGRLCKGGFEDACRRNGTGFRARLAWSPGQEELEQASVEMPGRCLASRPWKGVEGFAWLAGGIEAQLAAQAEGAGSSLQLAAPADSSQPIGLAASFCGQAVLKGATLKGRADARVVDEALQRLDLDAAALRWATLADALVAVLEALLDERRLTLAVESVKLPLGALRDLRSAALMEWACRIARHCRQASLGLPLAAAPQLRLPAEAEMSIDWKEAATIPLHEVRTLRPAGIEPPEIKLSPGPALPVPVRATGDWSGFSFVAVELSQGGQSAKLTLTPQSPGTIWRPGQSGRLEVEARAVASSSAAKVPVAVRHRGGGVEVELRPLSEQALLVRVPRRTLQLAGPLQVEIEHPALACQLTPKQGPLQLDAAQGDLEKVSSVYRALFWKGAEDQPFGLKLSVEGGAFPLRAKAQQGVIDLDPPLLHVLPPPQLQRGSVEVELAWSDASGPRRGLGSRHLELGQRAVWCLPPQYAHLELRSRYAEAPGGGYWTAWTKVEHDGAVASPWAGPRRVAAMLAAEASGPVEIEFSSIRGQGGAARAKLAPGQAQSIEFYDDATQGPLRFRRRLPSGAGREAGPWSKWQPTSSSVIKLAPHQEQTGETICC